MMIILYMILFSVFLVVSYDFFVGINWKCLFGNHRYIYIGQRHGMVRAKDGKGVIGSQRNIYKCCDCRRDKPIENSDYVG